MFRSSKTHHLTAIVATTLAFAATTVATASADSGSHSPPPVNADVPELERVSLRRGQLRLELSCTGSFVIRVLGESCDERAIGR
jgi:hypothetical protein